MAIGKYLAQISEPTETDSVGLPILPPGDPGLDKRLELIAHRDGTWACIHPYCGCEYAHPEYPPDKTPYSDCQYCHGPCL